MKEEQDASIDLLLSLGECPWYPLLLRLLTAVIPGFGECLSFISIFQRFFGIPSSDSNSFYLDLYNILYILTYRSLSLSEMEASSA